VEIIRPLVGATRAEVLAYLQTEGQEYRQDSSNSNRAFTRNRIRHELLPHLTEHYNPRLVPVLCHLAEQVAEVHQEVERGARELLAEAEHPRTSRLLIFDRRRLAAAPRHLVREVFRLVWVREGWPRGAMGFAAWDRLAAVVSGEVAAADLPGGIRAQGQERVVQIGSGP
jgi:tRNA(Ile)-lysidine synthase